MTKIVSSTSVAYDIHNQVDSITDDLGYVLDGIMDEASTAAENGDPELRERLHLLAQRVRELKVWTAELRDRKCSDLLDYIETEDSTEALDGLVECALDVERGIRDPEELSRLVHDHSPLAV